MWALHRTPRSSCRWRRSAITLLVLVAPLGAAATEPFTRPLETYIAGGIEDDRWPEVALVFADTGVCTATFVGCHTLVTAAHCVCNSEGLGSACANGDPSLLPDQLIVFSPAGGWFFIDEVQPAPDYSFGESGDIAILKLSSPMRGILPRSVNRLASPTLGTSATLVGFGRTQTPALDAGLKRSGNASVSDCLLAGVPGDTHVCWDYQPGVLPPGTNATICPGDSGGPLLGDVGEGLTLMGVHSGGVGVECSVDVDPFDTDVFAYSDWLDAQAGVDLDRDRCSQGPHSGEPGAETLSFTGTANGVENHAFPVVAGSKLLRVGLNGEIGSNNDLDLYLRRGAPPTATEFDCASTGGGPFEFCEIADPEAGTWHAVVDFASGFGAAPRYQLGVLALPEDPTPPAPIPGDLLVSNFYSNELTRVDSSDGTRWVTSSSLRGAGTPLAGPEGMVLDPAGRFLVANPFVPSLVRVDLETGARTTVSGCPDAECASTIGLGTPLIAPRWVDTTPSGRIVLADRESPGNAALVDVDPATGDRSVLSGCSDPSCQQVVGTGPLFDRLLEIAFEPGQDTILTADTRSLLRVDLDTGDRVVLSGCSDAACSSVVGAGPAFGEPMGLAFDPQGDLYVSYAIEGQAFGAVRRVDTQSGDRTLVSGCLQAACTSLRGAGPSFTAPLGMDIAEDGSLLVADEGRNAIVWIEPASGDRILVSGCSDGSCSAERGEGLSLSAPIDVVVVPEAGAAASGLAATLALSALLYTRSRARR